MKLDRDRLVRVCVERDSGPEGSALFTIHYNEFADGYRDTINAILDDIAAQGFAIVPVEPTERMIDAGIERATECTDDFTARSACIAGHVWTAMLSAAKVDE